MTAIRPEPVGPISVVHHLHQQEQDEAPPT
jgi:hypothetical protein